MINSQLSTVATCNWTGNSVALISGYSAEYRFKREFVQWQSQEFRVTNAILNQGYYDRRYDLSGLTDGIYEFQQVSNNGIKTREYYRYQEGQRREQLSLEQVEAIYPELLPADSH